MAEFLNFESGGESTAHDDDDDDMDAGGAAAAEGVAGVEGTDDSGGGDGSSNLTDGALRDHGVSHGLHLTPIRGGGRRASKANIGGGAGGGGGGAGVDVHIHEENEGVHGGDGGGGEEDDEDEVGDNDDVDNGHEDEEGHSREGHHGQDQSQDELNLLSSGMDDVYHQYGDQHHLQVDYDDGMTPMSAQGNNSGSGGGNGSKRKRQNADPHGKDKRTKMGMKTTGAQKMLVDSEQDVDGSNGGGGGGEGEGEGDVEGEGDDEEGDDDMMMDDSQQQQQQQQPSTSVAPQAPEEEDEDEEEEEEDDKEKEGVEGEAPPAGTTVVDGRTEQRAKHDEQAGLIDFVVVENDDSQEAMIVLTGAKNIFQKQLPKMPKEYITRLVYDRRHRTMAIVKKPTLQVIGAITFRPFEDRQFAEIVFCAVHSDNQVRGYGSLMMNHLKDFILAEGKIKYFLTYADNYAIGYFKKQGFSAEITLDKTVWVGYIKDYDGATLLQVSLLPFNPEKCAMIPRIDYLRIHETVNKQRDALQNRIREVSQSHIIYPGLSVFKEKGVRSVPLSSIPGLKEAGWTQEMSKANRSAVTNLQKTLSTLLTNVKQHGHAWPFIKPVNAEEVTDYYDMIKHPMDLATMERKLDNKEYQDLESFIADMTLIFNNCRLYNDESTPYFKCANTVERDFRNLLKQISKTSPSL